MSNQTQLLSAPAALQPIPSFLDKSDPKDGRCSDAPSTSRVAARLLRYLANRLAIPRLRYSAEPVPITDGWETYIFHFELQAVARLPSRFRGPLTLRLFAGPKGVSPGRHEFEIQQHMHALDYPVPRPVCWEEDCRFLGGPFQIMEQVGGPTLANYAIYRPWMVFTSAASMAASQVQLHRLSTEDFPTRREDLLDRTLNEIEGIIALYGMWGLAPGLKWLREHRPPPPESPSIVHLDFHPLNLIRGLSGGNIVLDWGGADVGDRHADVAIAILLTRQAPNPGNNLFERMIIGNARWLFVWLYLSAYRRRLSLQEDKLKYYLAWATLRRLSHFGRWLRAGGRVTGNKPSLVKRISSDHLRALYRYFERLTRVPVGL